MNDLSDSLTYHFKDYLEQNDDMKEGYIAALGFSALMGLGAGPRAMQTLLAGGAILAAASPFLKKDHETTGTEKLTQSALTLAAWARIHSGFNRARQKIEADIRAGVLEQIRNSPKDIQTQLARKQAGFLNAATYCDKNNVIQLDPTEVGSSVEIHERVHAHWRNLRLKLFGARAVLNDYVYYNVSEIFTHGLNTKLSWFWWSKEAYTEAVTALKTPFLASKGKLAGAIFVPASALFSAGVAAVFMAPLAYLMQQAANTYKHIKGEKAAAIDNIQEQAKE